VARPADGRPRAPIRTVVVGTGDEVTGEEAADAPVDASKAAARTRPRPGDRPDAGDSPAMAPRQRPDPSAWSILAAMSSTDGMDAAPRPRIPPPAPPGRFRSVAAAVLVYAAAMAFLESAVVVYLQRALGIDPRALFPLRDPAVTGDLALIEVGREAATLVMLGAVGWLAGRSGLERLAWTAVAFGTWDIFYYAWLWAFIGWPSSPGTWDLLFLIPVPWTGPVWAPIAISLALVGFGLAAARRLRAGRAVRAGRAQVAAGVMGGLVVILSLTLDAGRILAGGVPDTFAWPVFTAGLALAVWGATTTLRPPVAPADPRARAPATSPTGPPPDR
jgi:hypothetical protein